MTEPLPLTLNFERLDQLSVERFAGLDERQPANLLAVELGPYFEWLWLRRAGHRLGRVMVSSTLERLRHPLVRGLSVWTGSSPPISGFIRVRRHQAAFDDVAWISFRRAFERAALSSGLSTQHAKQLTGALGELEDNIHEHSEAASTGIVAYYSRPGTFEFVVLDRGIGVLSSLRRCQEYAAVVDHGHALEIALANGNSRYGKQSGRGYGFQDLYLGIANSRARLRFRSGDHLYELDGTVLGLPRARLAQRASGNGFLIAVRSADEPAPAAPMVRANVR